MEYEKTDEVASKIASTQGKVWEDLSEDDKEPYRILAKAAISAADDWEETYGDTDSNYFGCSC